MKKGLKLSWKVVRLLLKLVLYTITGIFLVFTINYLLAPVYVFPEPEPFSGEVLFNPYEGIDSNDWHKGNFQIQSEAWLGITDGRKNTNEMIDSIYGLLGYDVIPTSDYQKINRHGAESDTYIPVYEHGYGIRKNHHVMIGADRVCWIDYPIFQNIHHKQHMVNILRPTTRLMFIAHPNLRHGWKADDMTWLTNYDGIEVLNGYRRSIEHWDAALSAGRNMRILANDDAHDISNRNEVGNYFNMIHSRVLHGDSIVEAMQDGRSYGVYVYRTYGEPMDEKIEKALNLPKLSAVELTGDTLSVEVSEQPKMMKFIGQNGITLDSLMYRSKGQYIIRDSDTYVRTQVHLRNGTVFYLNPVIRYDGGDPWQHELARVDVKRTWLLRIIGFASLIFLIVNIYYLRRRFKRSA